MASDSNFLCEAKTEDGWRPVTLAGALGAYRLAPSAFTAAMADRSLPPFTARGTQAVDGCPSATRAHHRGTRRHWPEALLAAFRHP